MDELSHVDADGNVRMVDVGGKPETVRQATARAVVAMAPQTKGRVFAGTLPKGEVLSVVRIAAIQGAKRTSDLVPLCHPLRIDAVNVEISEASEGVEINVIVRTTGRTGVEMEAMTGASIGALTMYDMIKGVDRGASIETVELLHKSGGASGEWNRG